MTIKDCQNCGGDHYGSNECPYLEKNMGEPCTVCQERTSYCCSDCAIDGVGKVYVCVKEACRTEHEKKHTTTPVTREIEARLKTLLAEIVKPSDPNLAEFIEKGLAVTARINVTKALAAMSRAYSLDRASGDGVRVTDEMVDAALRAYHHFGPEIPVSGLGAGQTRMREALAAALSAGSIPTGDKNV